MELKAGGEVGEGQATQAFPGNGLLCPNVQQGLRDPGTGTQVPPSYENPVLIHQIDIHRLAARFYLIEFKMDSLSLPLCNGMTRQLLTFLLCGFLYTQVLHL